MERNGHDSSGSALDAACLFARDRLGPSSAALLSTAQARAALEKRLRDGADLEDAVLGVVHEAAGQRSGLAGEFLAYFIGDVLRLGHHRISAEMRRHLDSGDLVQSVLGDLWPRLREVRFESRASFLALLRMRTGWKAIDKVRAQGAIEGDEERREELAEVGKWMPDGSPTPLEHVEARDDLDQLVLVLMQLPDADRRLLTMQLKGWSVERIAGEVGITRSAARKSLYRARQRAQEFLQHRQRSLGASS